MNNNSTLAGNAVRQDGKDATESQTKEIGTMSNQFNMPTSVRAGIVEFASTLGFRPVEKSPGQDKYVKLITLKKPGMTVCIDKVTGFSEAGDLKWIKTILHPDHFRKDLTLQIPGVKERLTAGKNWHRHSGFQDFVHDGQGQPAGMAYEVDQLDNLKRLLSALTHSAPSDLPIKAPNTSLSSEPPVIKNTQNRGEDFPKLVDAIQRQPRKPAELSRPPEKGLIIDEPWIGMILRGEKVWEMRTQHVRIRGPVALIRKGSGCIVGVADLVDSKGPFDNKEMLDNIHNHCIGADLITSGQVAKWKYAWVLENAKPLPEEVPYRHKSGSVIWVDLDAGVVNRVANLCR